jgi:Anticodon binding domain
MRATSMIQILDGEGSTIWRGPAENAPQDHAAINALLGEGVKENIHRAQVLQTAEELGFVSRKGTPKGFLNILPRGTALQSKVDAFNARHIESLHAVRIDFPSIYEIANSPSLQNLTHSYETQGRVFHIDNPTGKWRLAYAADPGLLTYLEGRILDPKALPYAIASPMSVFRRYQSGECGGLDKNREYYLPDLHILCGDDSRETFVKNLTLASEGAKFWERSPEHIALFIDVLAEFLTSWPTLGEELARAAGIRTLIRTFATRPRYYAFRAGIVLYTGVGAVMLYNFQWDDTNPGRFHISRSDGGNVVLIHATLAAGWPKLLPWIIGRGLTGLSPKIIPAELDSPELTILPVRTEHTKHAVTLAADLQSKGRDVQIDGEVIPLGARVRRLRNRWTAYHIVIGPREIDGSAKPRVESPYSEWEPVPLSTFEGTIGPRLDRCRSGTRNKHLPFVV